MRKLYLLKAIVDFVWIMAVIFVPFLLFFIGYLLISNEPFDVPIKMNGIEITVLDLNAKIVLFFATLSYLVLSCSFVWFIFNKKTTPIVSVEDYF